MKSHNQKLAQVTGNVVVVGIDVAKHRHWATILDGNGFSLTQPFSLQNTRDGFLRLRACVDKAKQQTGASGAVVGLEPTGHYWKPLAWFLKQTGYSVVLVNPYHVKRSKEMEDNSPTKSDRKDAGLIASLVKQGKFMSCLFPESTYADLRNLHVTRDSQRRQMNSALNRLQAWLDEYFPEFTTVFKSVTGKAASWVLEHLPLPSDILAIGVEELTECLKRASTNRVGLKRAEMLRVAAEWSIGIPTGLTGARQRLSASLEELRFYERQLQVTEAKLAEALAATGLAEVLLSVPGIGIVTAAGFLAEVGDVSNYRHAHQLRKLAGLNLTEQSSGQKKGQRTISKRGRPGLRRVLYQIALGLVCNNAEFKALYQHLKTRSPNPLVSTSALVAIMSKVLRMLFHLIKHREQYDANKVRTGGNAVAQKIAA
jgi:transposase